MIPDKEQFKTVNEALHSCKVAVDPGQDMAFYSVNW